MIIVNSLEVAKDLLDVRGANFSDRPVIPMGGELAGFNNTLPLAHYGDRMRKERKLFHRFFGTQPAVKQFVPLLSTEIRKLLRNILSSPDGLIDEIRRCVKCLVSWCFDLLWYSATGAISLRIAYGYRLRDGPGRDPLLEMFETAGHNFMNSTPAAFLVDIIPLCEYPQHVYRI
jgi:hypothetical protein